MVFYCVRHALLISETVQRYKYFLDMTVIEVLKFNRELIKNLRRIVVVLAQRYHVCERKVYDLIKRFRAECGGNVHRGDK